MSEDLHPTGGQTIGPFFGFALPYDGGESLVPEAHPGAVQLTGLVLDGDTQPVPDALVEVWQPDAEGQIHPRAGSLHRDPRTVTGWGRSATDRAGRYRFTTILPGGADPFFALAVFARGLTHLLFTRAYLPGAGGRFLDSVPASRRDTLLVTEEDGRLLFDIRLQGENETVFLSFPGLDE